MQGEAGPLICTWQYLCVLLYKLLHLIKKVEAPVRSPGPSPRGGAINRLALIVSLCCSSLFFQACGGSSSNGGGGGGPATHLLLSSSTTATVGTAFNVTVTALDASNNTVTTYSGTVHFTSTDVQAMLPSDVTLTNGTKSFSVTLKTAGNQTITATDTVHPSITGTSSSISVSGIAAATHFSITTPANATAGTPFNVTVTALDASNNTVTTYSGTVHFTSTDGQAALPADSKLNSGAGSFMATLNTAGNQTISATDTVTAIAGISNSINITPPVDTITLVPPTLSFGNTTVGQSKSLSTILTNTGEATLSISKIGIGESPSNFSEVNTSGTSLAPGSSCTITVTFTPMSSGPKAGDVIIHDNAIGNPQDVHLRGKGKKKMNSAAIRSALTKSVIISAPSVSGSVRVGTKEVDMVDFSREDPYTANGAPRELLVRLWYPAEVSGGCTPAAYAASKVWDRFSELVGVPLPSVNTNSCTDAPVMDGVHPIVIFTPGYTGTMTDYTFLFEDLASRGYIVASVDHTFEATAVEFTDGRFVQSVFGSYLGGIFRGDVSAMTFAVSVRLHDLQFVLNELDEMNKDSGNAFAGKLDMSRIALAGHSMGGVTTLLGLQQDPRFKAGVVIDGDFTNTMPSPTLTPVLILGMGRQQWAGEECSLWNELDGPRLAVNFLGADHMTPTEGVWIAEGAIPAGDMGVDKTVTALRRYVAAFLDANLRGRPWDSLLFGSTAEFPAARVTSQNQSLCGEKP